ncbi:MAG: hypothetical protein IPN01_32565 [Deltaproteobacteria bacterium]|nr:hypothetical protein [Deltaproteobacteria bacterium]
MSLFRPGENVERVAEGVRARVIIDGEAYFQASPPPQLGAAPHHGLGD